MFSANAKMSLEASDVQTDEDCEELVEDGFSLPADVPVKKSKRKAYSAKPPPSPRSPYLTSLNVNTRKAAVGAWRLPTASLGDTRLSTPGETGPVRLTSLSNGHGVSQTLRSECDDTPELLRQTLSTRKSKHLQSASNGFTLVTSDLMEKEDMYDEIIHLKKSLNEQKSDNQQMKAKLRRLEEDNAKREKQIEALLDPTKGSEYTRSLVDRKREGSVVITGLKQRILKLEQQCREKENAFSKLQSELRTTNLEELKIRVKSYFEEIQRLSMLLEAAEKSCRAESKCSQRQQKALSSTVHRLSENLKQLQQENVALREELNTDSPAGGVKDYREWSKQRLLRRLLEVEKRLEGSRRHSQSQKSTIQLDKEVQTTPIESLGFTMATEAVVSVGTLTEERDDVFELRERLSQLEEEKMALEELLSSKDDELKQLKTDREKLEKETQQWKAEQKKLHDELRRQHKQESKQLQARIQTLEEERSKLAQAELSSLPPTMAEETHEDTQGSTGLGEERVSGCKEEAEGDEVLAADEEKKEMEKAALDIQTCWREHRNRDTVMLQSALRGHLLRDSQLKELQEDAQNQVEESSNFSDGASSVDKALDDDDALTVLQSAFRGHLARCSLAQESPVPSLMENKLPTLVPRSSQLPHPSSRTDAASLGDDGEEEGAEENMRPLSSTYASRRTLTKAQTEFGTAEIDGDAAFNSDDSDDIIVSPSHPPRS
ncbi:IQ domain-containing protein E isoform X2 [Archocentrus centrarchus]|uniref:IQ domain-containing protein E isoform X2 n=1 Tax=Archocentrus centrarchus TaxID=63155 RepID=UPI0011EA11BB|nr:IQ domain-containing protein E isoform X2 [Archocentrus centrarchus]